MYAVLSVFWAALQHSAAASIRSFASMRGSLGLARNDSHHATHVHVNSTNHLTNANVAYLGCGCFWHVQHVMVHFEQTTLGRMRSDITAFAGYAGGTAVGDGGRVCYHNHQDVADYGALGHAEVVSIALPDAATAAKAARMFFSQICRGGVRIDVQDVGPEYRATIGFPGGITSPQGAAFVAEGNQHGVTVEAGQGNDPDTLGTVYVMDTASFPFHQAELFHQFHDDMVDDYSSSYHDLRQEHVSSGAISPTGCPGDT